VPVAADDAIIAARATEQGLVREQFPDAAPAGDAYTMELSARHAPCSQSVLEHSSLRVHMRQVPVAMSQTGFGLLHCALVVHTGLPMQPFPSQPFGQRTFWYVVPSAEQDCASLPMHRSNFPGVHST
jgi:hypothetical protein